MPQDRPLPGTPQDWLTRAKSDLALARVPLPQGAFYEDLCFHAQQAAEKALKAVYQFYGWTFRYTHDLAELVADLRRKGLAIPPQVDEATVLTSFAWETRYPGPGRR
jgi:HEPN domain-containing protein